VTALIDNLLGTAYLRLLLVRARVRTAWFKRRNGLPADALVVPLPCGSAGERFLALGDMDALELDAAQLIAGETEPLARATATALLLSYHTGEDPGLLGRASHDDLVLTLWAWVNRQARR
jgi:hypothetical protein